MKNIKIEIRWSIIFVIMTLFWMVMEKLLGFHDKNIHLHPIISNFIAIPAILIFVLALREKKKVFYDNQMTYKQGFISGLIISLIITLFSPLTQTITSLVITPDYFANVIAYSVENKIMSTSDAEVFFNLKSYIIQGMIGAPIMGVVTTAIVMIFVRSK